MRRYAPLVLTFVIGTAVDWVVNAAPPRQQAPPKPAPARSPDRIMIGRPEPNSPSGRAWHTLRVVPTVGLSPDQKLTDEWVVTVLTDDIASGDGVTAVSYTAK
ncbi:unnamed protein product [Gemmata massiliana]|uniref:Uncharacterized protein n=1 Tax=Gemmata massiliana TaxID=1210884 RepID=A0A6P2DGN1_9BACT|nr:hypothetical protein [Gemmata massiliana]VTS00734.1 unnamed protein product [Gemmata massiliana]